MFFLTVKEVKFTKISSAMGVSEENCRHNKKQQNQPVKKGL